MSISSAQKINIWFRFYHLSPNLLPIFNYTNDCNFLTSNCHTTTFVSFKSQPFVKVLKQKLMKLASKSNNVIIIN
uniref:Carbon catabolite repressor protein 4 homolog 3 isoform X4 n=1 Tax=Rhizophora mucronata TaxID=61149 RepID=A0A2P2L0R6_RHIMU